MSRNIKYQIFNAIESAFITKVDKHSAKAQQRTGTYRIYSYADRNNVKDFAANFSNWIKAEHPEIRQVKDITSDIAQEFIDYKAKTVTKATLEQYISKLTKVAKIINHRYKTANVDFSVKQPEQKNQDKKRAIAFTREDFRRVMKFYKDTNSSSQAVVAVDLAGRFALRVADTTQVQPRDLNGNSLHIHRSKGARSRDIKISDADREYLEKLFDGHRPDENVVKIKPGSVNRSLNRTLAKLGIDRYRKAKSGVHSIRKMVAQEMYDSERAKGFSKKESMNIVSVYLGHGKDREALIREYVLNIH